jgi:ribosomal protein S18 acetylase RimI-like enzyme
MPRDQVVVRAPRDTDVPALLGMWDELRQASGRNGSLAPASTEKRLLDRLAAIQGMPGCRVLVAELETEAVGVAVLQASPMGPFHDEPMVHIDYLHVRPGRNNRGVGHALMSAAVAFAEECGAEHLSVNVLPQLREAQRFYARLGFSPLVLRRVASTTGLRRKLEPQPVVSRQLARVLARRRSLLRSPASG